MNKIYCYDNDFKESLDDYLFDRENMFSNFFDDTKIYINENEFIFHTSEDNSIFDEINKKIMSDILEKESEINLKNIKIKNQGKNKDKDDIEPNKVDKNNAESNKVDEKGKISDNSRVITLILNNKAYKYRISSKKYNVCELTHQELDLLIYSQREKLIDSIQESIKKIIDRYFACMNIVYLN